MAEKDAVARRCAELVQDGETVLLDIGTTAHRVARQLRGRPLTVVTSNLAVYEELADDNVDPARAARAACSGATTARWSAS